MFNDDALLSRLIPYIRRQLAYRLVGAMAETRSTKLLRLERFRRNLPHVSAIALHAVLEEVDRQGIPSGHSRRNFARARDAIALEASTPYGRLLQTIELDGKLCGKVMLRFVHPFAFLWHAFSACPPFHSLITERMHVHPCTMDVPWNLILYSDEVTPSNVLARDVTRKIQAVYFSFKELGYSALAREDAWFCLTVNRSSVVKRIQGGMSAILFCALEGIIFHRDQLIGWRSRAQTGSRADSAAVR